MLLQIAEHSFLWLSSTYPWRRQWHPTPVLLPGKYHGLRSQVGCSPWGLEESDMTEQLHFHFSLSCLGEGNGNPLQCSCLENPRDGGAWWAAVSRVAQSRTRLKRLSSSSSSMSCLYILEINPLSVASFVNISFQSIGYLFILFMVSFAMQKHLSSVSSHLFILVCFFKINLF